MPNKAAGKILTSTDNHRNQVFSFYFLLVFLITINYVYLAASQKNTKMSRVKVVIKVAEEHQFMQMMQRGIVVELAVYLALVAEDSQLCFSSLCWAAKCQSMNCVHRYIWEALSFWKKLENA